MSPRLLLTPGDPVGIGPEVTLAALRDDPRRDEVTVVGAWAPLAREAARFGLTLHAVDRVDGAAPDGSVAVYTPAGDEPLEVLAIREAVAACLDGRGSALVTGPIHKARLAAQGFGWAGHTDFLAHLCGSTDPVMAFVGGQLRVALVTVHLPLRAVADAVTQAKVLHTVQAAHRALVDQLGIAEPRLLICGLNPHAGDDGLLGREEIDVIQPAVAQAKALGILAEGPISAEAAFRRAMAGDGDMVIAMYHDQGLAPLKAVDFGRSVNWTLGLPIIRTSVDHGTADDLVGQGVADPASMRAALAWARELVAQRRTRAD